MSLYETYDVYVETVHPAPCPICGPTRRETRESEPTVDILEDQTVTRHSSVPLPVTYHASSPVTIIWSVGSNEVDRQTGRIAHGNTKLTIPSFDHRHHGKRFGVEVVDQRGRGQGTSCVLTMRYY